MVQQVLYICYLISLLFIELRRRNYRLQRLSSLSKVLCTIRKARLCSQACVFSKVKPTSKGCQIQRWSCQYFRYCQMISNTTTQLSNSTKIATDNIQTNESSCFLVKLHEQKHVSRRLNLIQGWQFANLCAILQCISSQIFSFSLTSLNFLFSLLKKLYLNSIEQFYFNAFLMKFNYMKVYSEDTFYMFYL